MDLEVFKEKCQEVSASLKACCKEDKRHCAEELLRIQERLRILRGVRTSPATAKEEVLWQVEQDLVHQAEGSGVKLKPPKESFPAGLRNFDYFHTVRGVPLKGGEAGPGPGLERNLLLVLHGFGGRKEPFSSLPQKFSLPTTAFVIFNAPQALPEELLDDPPGYSWFDTIDLETGDFIPADREETRRSDSLKASVELLWQCVDVLTTSCGWQPQEIFFFGYGQGGTVALDAVLRPPAGALPLGGVIAVAAEVLPEVRMRPAPAKPKGLAVPVLLINGALDRCVSPESADASARYLQALGSPVEFRLFQGRGGEMLRGEEEESRCFMTFLSDHLNGVGRKGSAEATAEAMRKIGAELVGETPFAEPAGQLAAGPAMSSGHLDEMD